jgi:hypothetical protein
VNRSRSVLAVLAVLALAVVVELTARIGSGEHAGGAAPARQGIVLPTSTPALSDTPSGHARVAHSDFQEAVKAVAEHDPTGAVWQLYDRCVVLPDAQAFRDRMTRELSTGGHQAYRVGLQIKVVQADALLAAPYADICLDAFEWAAASSAAGPDAPGPVP